MPVPVRVAITGMLLFVLLAPVVALGVSACLNGRFTVDDLSGQILQQTGERIVERTRAMLERAKGPAGLVARHLETRYLEPGKPLDRSVPGGRGTWLWEEGRVSVRLIEKPPYR